MIEAGECAHLRMGRALGISRGLLWGSGAPWPEAFSSGMSFFLCCPQFYLLALLGPHLAFPPLTSHIFSRSLVLSLLLVTSVSCTFVCSQCCGQSHSDIIFTGTEWRDPWLWMNLLPLCVMESVFLDYSVAFWVLQNIALSDITRIDAWIFKHFNNKNLKQFPSFIVCIL